MTASPGEERYPAADRRNFHYQLLARYSGLTVSLPGDIRA